MRNNNLHQTRGLTQTSLMLSFAISNRWQLTIYSRFLQ
jgi:hypothetical protein